MAEMFFDFNGKNRGLKYHCRLQAFWELDFETLSSEYDIEDISAYELFEEWAHIVSEQYPNGLIPISWYVVDDSERILGRMPFQYDAKVKDFLDSYTTPKSEGGEEINWLTLAVSDKFWSERTGFYKGYHGGFIQEVTGWKPSPLQPYVFLPSLLKSAGKA